MHKIAEIVFEQELEVIPSYIEDNPPENNNRAIWHLGKSIQLLAEADFFIGIEETGFYNGCRIESTIARCYNIKSTFVKMRELMPDALQTEENYWNEI